MYQKLSNILTVKFCISVHKKKWTTNNWRRSEKWWESSFRAGVHAPPASQALEMHLAKHHLWINQITFTLHYPSATRGGATCYLNKGASSFPRTKSTESWQIPLADLSWNSAVWVIHPSDRHWLFKPGVQVRVGFSLSWNPRKYGCQEAVFTRKDDVTWWPYSWMLDSPPKMKTKK